MARNRGALAQGTAVALATVAAVAFPVAAAAELGSGQTRVHEPPPPVKRPPDGALYTGTHKLVMRISGKSIEIAAFRFPCKAAKGNTSLSGIPLKKTDKGYKFDIESFGIVTYSDSETHPDQNGQINLAGRFSRDAKSVKGHFRVRTPRCDTGRIDFTGKLQS